MKAEKKDKNLIEKDVTRYSSKDGYSEFEFGEIRVKHNPASYGGCRIEQIEYDGNKKPIVRKINLSHNQMKQLKRLIREYYPRD